MKLIAVTTKSQPGALELLTALGEGENGFGGTPVGKDLNKLNEWLDYCEHIAKAPALSDYFAPQNNYWITDETGYVVGLVRLHVRLNDDLLNKGGHVGYYVAPAFRDRGYGKGALKLALAKLRAKGVKHALVTIESYNIVSLGIAKSLGGVQEDERVDGETGQAFHRFWLETKLRTKKKQKAA